MAQPGTERSPLRVAIVGSGPAGFYAAQHLFNQQDLTVEVDMYDRLPTPYGLVRFGVAQAEDQDRGQYDGQEDSCVGHQQERSGGNSRDCGGC